MFNEMKTNTHHYWDFRFPHYFFVVSNLKGKENKEYLLVTNCRLVFVSVLRIGHVDSSGLRIKMVSQLRQFDAGVMELGLEYTDKMAIPPGQVAFPLSGYCIAECTELVS